MMKPLDRRACLLALARLAGTSAVASVLPIASRRAEASGGSGNLIVIHLSGAWNANLAIDPVIGTKLAGDGYDPAYRELETGVVPGKPRLALGPGFLPASFGFAAVPTAFVNGMLMEITAHDIATGYMQTGTTSGLRGISRAAFTAGLGAATKSPFPAHVMLGGRMPLGDSDADGPGLFASNVERLTQTLRAPSPYYADATWSTLTGLTAKLDSIHASTLEGAAKADVARMLNTRRAVLGVTGDMADAAQMTSDVETRYGAGDPGSPGGLMAGAYLCLRGKLCRFVAVTIGGFDTHSNELDRQLPRQRLVAKALGQLLVDLKNTPDPWDSSRSLIETTTVYLTSEFVRTPRFNGNGGTDHQPCASAIVCGRGVVDGAVVGATNDKGRALGWAEGRAQSMNDRTRLMPEYVGAALLHHMGQPDTSMLVSERRVEGLFRG